MYRDETSSVTNNELEVNLPMVRSLLRKSLVVCGQGVEDGGQ